MDIFLQGLLFGLALNVMAGPILFTLLQTGIEEGFKAGIKVGLGIWISDFLYITICYLGLSYVIELSEWDNFHFYVGILGGCILLGVGIAGLMSKPIQLDGSHAVPKNSSSLALWLKGFMINTVNPFTLLFWMSTMSTAVLNDKLSQQDVFIFFGTIMFTIIATDSMKVYLAKWIRTRMNDQYLLWLRRGSGIVFIVFGIVLIARVSL